MRLNSACFLPAPNQYFVLVDSYNVEHFEIVRFEPNDRLFLHGRYSWRTPFSVLGDVQLHY